jgi:hypothetical protein
MSTEASFITLNGHLLYWSPTVFGFTQIPDNRNVILYNKINNGVKAGIINHDKPT